MEGIIKVNPQELINTSNEFQSRNTAINDITGQMLTLARNLGSQWEGDLPQPISTSSMNWKTTCR